MSDIMSTVCSQIQGTINEAISVQILPQIQATLKSTCLRGDGEPG